MTTQPLSNGYAQSTASPTTYTRPLGGAELGPALAISAARPHPREPIRIHIFHHLRSPLAATAVTQAFRNGWLALRLTREPDIATTFSADDQAKSYTVSQSDADHEAWLNHTFHIAPANSTVESIVRDEQKHFEPLPKLHLIPSEIPESTAPTRFTFTILLLISHWRTEAQGCHLLLSTLYDLVASTLQQQSTQQSRSPSLLPHHHHTANELPLLTPSPGSLAQPAGPPSPTSPARLAAQARVAATFKAFSDKGPCIALPTTPSNANAELGPGPVGVARRVYTDTGTRGLVAAAKADGVSVTAVVHAAYISAVWRLRSGHRTGQGDGNGNEGKWYVSMMPVSIRSRLRGDPDDSARWRGQGCWNSAQMILLTSPPPSVAGEGQGMALLDRARGLKECYNVSEREEWLRDEYAEWEAQMGEFHRTVGAGTVADATPWFTGLGVLDRGMLGREYRGGVGDGGESLLTVEDVHGWADPLAPGCVLTVWTFRERLNVQISWNMAFHERGLIGEILDGMEDTLAEELGLRELRTGREDKAFEY